jgi:membrane-bound serine protease (ClpP class)
VNLLLAAADGGADTYLVLGLVFTGVALFLFMLELIVPSGGMLGLLCALAGIASIGSMFMHDPIWGAATLAAYAVLAPIAIVFGIKLWTSSPLAKRMILRSTESIEDPEARAAEAGSGANISGTDPLAGLVGERGRTVTPLRPVGFVRVGGRRIDAVADFGVIDADCEVVVVEVRDHEVRVRPANP